MRDRFAPYWVFVLVAVFLVTACTVATAVTYRPAPAASLAAMVPVVTTSPVAELDSLPVRPLATTPKYTRQAFGVPWADVDHNGCDTRDDILARDLISVQRLGKCEVTAGELLDPYTGTRVDFHRGRTTSLAVQIDHVVALGDAWATGMDVQTPAQRLAFANDPRELLAVSGVANDAKGDKDASRWLPRPVYQCRYVETQISVKHLYGLSVTPAEAAAMRTVLIHC